MCDPTPSAKMLAMVATTKEVSPTIVTPATRVPTSHIIGHAEWSLKGKLAVSADDHALRSDE